MKWRHKIIVFAETLGLDPHLVEAVLLQESAGNPWAYNPEPQYRYLWDIANHRPFRPLTTEESRSKIPPADFPSPPGVSKDAEWWAQQASFGLMQVIGSVARERGFRGDFLTELCDPDVGLRYGCLHLKVYLDKYAGDRRKALLAYNGGPGATMTTPARNESYAIEVLAKWDALRKGS